MKKCCFLRSVIAMIIVVAISISTHAVTLSVEQDDEKIYVDKGVQDLLNEYFGLRKSVLDYSLSGEKSEVIVRKVEEQVCKLTDSSTLVSLHTGRLSASNNLIVYHGVYPAKYEVSFDIESCDIVTNNLGEISYTLDVYEWTWVDYTNGRDTDPNKMGYATDHEILILKGKDGVLKIVRDTYDEADILGTQSRTFEEINVSEEFSSIQGLDNRATSTNTGVYLDVNRVIDYADQYVIHSVSSGMSTAYYNTPMYGYYSGNDCANFVSQCLKAGGMVDDYGTGKDNENADDTQWWYDTYSSPTNDNYSASPMAWRYVPSFINYWTQKGYSKVSASNSSVFPGNPVLSGDNHVGICVGYNSAGTPIINAHNRDVYHVPYTMIGSGTRTTIRISTYNKMAYKPSDATAISPTSSTQSIPKTLASGANHYYKLVVSSADEFTFYSTGSIDVEATLYKESTTSGGQTLYLYQYSADDDGGSGYNFSISEYLSAGTYYIRVRGVSQYVTGGYTFCYRTE